MCFEIETCPVCGLFVHYEEFDAHLEVHKRPEVVAEPELNLEAIAVKKASH